MTVATTTAATVTLTLSDASRASLNLTEVVFAAGDTSSVVPVQLSLLDAPVRQGER